jgi:hypothetical protein
MDKQCNKCNTTYPLENFVWSKRDGYNNVCKPCARNYMKEKRKDKNYIYTQKAKKFNTTVDVISSLYETHLVCQICNTKDRRELNVDHCHTTGKVRGLLCDNCNKALGLFKDSTDLLAKAANYLRRTNEH